MIDTENLKTSTDKSKKSQVNIDSTENRDLGTHERESLKSIHGHERSIPIWGLNKNEILALEICARTDKLISANPSDNALLSQAINDYIQKLNLNHKHELAKEIAKEIQMCYPDKLMINQL